MLVESAAGVKRVITLFLFVLALSSVVVHATQCINSFSLLSLRGGGFYESSLIEFNPDYIPPPHVVQRQSSRSAPFLSPSSARQTRNNPPSSTRSTSSVQRQISGVEPPPHAHVQLLEPATPSQQELSQPFFIEATSFSLESFTWQEDRQPSYAQQSSNALRHFYHTFGPSISHTTALCLVVFVLWQFPVFHAVLGRWFVCQPNQLNPFSMVLSSLSHANLSHLLLNLTALIRLGGPVRQILAQSSSPSSWPLWPLMLGSSLTGSLFHLLLGSRNGCMGLSDVTLALLAVYAKMVPNQPLGVWIAGVLPLRLPASQLLNALFVWSCVGTLMTNRQFRGSWSPVVAHAAHLGGLTFGLAYFEVWSRRNQWYHWLHRKRHSRPFW